MLDLNTKLVQITMIILFELFFSKMLAFAIAAQWENNTYLATQFNVQYPCSFPVQLKHVFLVFSSAAGCPNFPFFCHSLNQNQTLVDFLISNQADVTAKTWNGNTSLHIAAFKGSKDIVGILCSCQKLTVGASNIFGMCASHLAAKFGHLSVLKVFIFKDECFIFLLLNFNAMHFLFFNYTSVLGIFFIFFVCKLI